MSGRIGAGYPEMFALARSGKHLAVPVHGRLLRASMPPSSLDAISLSASVPPTDPPTSSTPSTRTSSGWAPTPVPLAVGRPARDLDSTTAIAAENLAFCPDNIDQGPGSIQEYAPDVIDLARWDFWWD